MNQQTITVVGGNLFQIATQAYGDATRWTDIARANGLSDPQLSGTLTLTLPILNGAGTGGILIPDVLRGGVV